MSIETRRLIDRYGLGRAGHSHFSPSSSAGWLNCSGFLLANAGKPDMAGVDAAYGTVAHEVAAELLRGGDPTIHRGVEKLQNGYTITIDDEMLLHVNRYVEWCREVEIEGDVFVEQHVDYSAYMPIPEQGGTADHFVCAPGQMIITDLKMGTGVRVFVENNSQAMLYALGVFLEWDWMYGFEEIVIRICQPRLDYFGVWNVSRGELLKFGEYARDRALLAWRENAPRSPSPKACQWCADLACPARSAHLDTLVDDAFDDATYSADEMSYHREHVGDAMKKLPEAGASSTALLAWRYGHRAMYEKWFRQIGDELLARAQAGEEIPGWKVVSGRRSFQWIDAHDAATGLAAHLNYEDIYVVEVISVARARKALRAHGLPAKEVEAFLNEGEDALVRVTSGRPTLAPATDERGAADDVFETEE